jgi:predicted ATPase
VDVLQLNAALVDRVSGRFVRHGSPGALGPRQVRLLRALTDPPGVDRSRDELLAFAWDGGDSSRVVDAAVRTLRRDLEDDPSSPDHVLTVHGAGYRFEPGPPPEPADGLPGGLDPFFGRGGPLFAVGEAFAGGARFVSILGPAGVGKTRLALRFAASRRCHGFGAGRVFVELAEVRSRSGVVRELARALGVPAGAGVRSRLVHVLGSRGGVLVVLDNLEQLPDEVGGLLTGLSDDAPEVRWLLTSQRPPDVPGDVVRLRSLAEGSASALFVQRARAVGAHEDLDLAGVARICSRLERLPLAVELAAARVPTLGLEGLEARLGRSLDVLVAGARPRPERHSTLESSIRWSWELLDASDRAALARCSVFRGPFDAAVAAAVGVPDLDGLVQASLLQPWDAGTFRLTLPVRSFAVDRLAERDDAAATHLAHARWFRALSAELAASINTAGEGAAAESAQQELPNLRAALQTLANDDPEAGLEMALELSRLLRPRTSRELHVELLDIARAGVGPESDADLVAMADAEWASAASEGGHPDAPAVAEAAAARVRGDGATAFVLIRAGNLARRRGDNERASALLLRAAEAAQAAGDASQHSQALVYLGIVEENTGRFAAAAERFERALERARQGGNQRVAGVCATNLSIVARRRGDREASRRYRAMAAEAYEQIQSRVFLAELTLNGAVADLSFCDAVAARDGLLRARDELAAVGDAIGETLAIANLGMAHLMSGDRAAAVACLEDGAGRHALASMGRYEAYALLSLGLAHQIGGELAAAGATLERARELFAQSGDVGPHAVADALLGVVREEEGGGAEALFASARERADGSRDESCARATRVLCGDEAPGANLSSYDWMASAALAARDARSQSRRGSGTA